MIWFLPILAGVFVDRFGFRITLIASFVIFTAGYFLIGFAALPAGQAVVEATGKTTYVVATLILTAIGGSLIKPCVVGTVARTARPESKALGFSIYYTLVNVGAAIAPFLATFVRQEFGIQYVLITSSAISFLNVVGTVLFFGEPASHDGSAPAATKTSFSKVFGDMLLVFSNARFMLFLLVFSTFWIMFWQMYLTLPFFARDVLGIERFETLAAFEAVTIIALSVPLTAVVRKWSPLGAMITGFVIASLAWIVMAFSTNYWMAGFGLVVLAIGEATQAPRFYEYVSTLAPKEQVGTFMGFSFLPIAIGYFTSGFLSRWLMGRYMPQGQPAEPVTMWMIVAGIGMAGAVLLFLYNQAFARRPETAAAAAS
jgi:MFS family permease